MRAHPDGAQCHLRNSHSQPPGKSCSRLSELGHTLAGCVWGCMCLLLYVCDESTDKLRSTRSCSVTCPVLLSRLALAMLARAGLISDGSEDGLQIRWGREAQWFNSTWPAFPHCDLFVAE